MVVALAALGGLGYRATTINGPSMGRSVPLGSLAFFQAVPAPDLRNGDVVAVRQPGSAPVVHRIVDVRYRDGELVATLLGDSNASDDPGPLRLQGDVSRLAVALPWVGYAIAFVSSSLGALLVVGCPLALAGCRTALSIHRLARTGGGMRPRRLLRAARLRMAIGWFETRHALGWNR
jgi:signal peptidase I